MRHELLGYEYLVERYPARQRGICHNPIAGISTKVLEDVLRAPPGCTWYAPNSDQVALR